MVITTDYSGSLLFFFENGKAAKIGLSAYETKTNRKKLLKAFCDQSPLVACGQISEDCEFLLTSSQGRLLLVHSGAIPVKTTRSSQGVAAMKLRKGARVLSVRRYAEGMLNRPDRYRRNIPAAGTVPQPDEQAEQMTLE